MEIVGGKYSPVTDIRPCHGVNWQRQPNSPFESDRIRDDSALVVLQPRRNDSLTLQRDQQGSLTVALFRSFPSPVTAMAGTAALGLSRELRTQPIRNRPCTSRRGQVEHRPVAISPASSRPPRQAHSQRATSCRNKFMIRDRGSNFTAAFDAVFQAAGTRILVSAVQAPRMNAICERLVGTLRREVIDRTLILGQGHLRAVFTEVSSALQQC